MKKINVKDLKKDIGPQGVGGGVNMKAVNQVLAGEGPLEFSYDAQRAAHNRSCALHNAVKRMGCSGLVKVIQRDTKVFVCLAADLED